jgi:hypothetical protein
MFNHLAANGFALSTPVRVSLIPDEKPSAARLSLERERLSVLQKGSRPHG